MAKQHDEEAVPTLALRILTPHGEAFQGDVLGLEAVGGSGTLEVLPRHEPLLTPLSIGPLFLRFVSESGETVREEWAVQGGFLEVNREAAVLLADSAERAEQIDIERARAAAARARQRIEESRTPGEANIDIDRAQLALLRSLNRLRVAGQPVEGEMPHVGS